jgi:hypothetical protein
VDDVEGGAGDLGEGDGSVGGLGLEQGVPDLAVVAGVGPAGGCSTRTSMAMPFSACIMIRPPLAAPRCIARRILPSSL